MRDGAGRAQPRLPEKKLSRKRKHCEKAPQDGWRIKCGSFRLEGQSSAGRGWLGNAVHVRDEAAP